MLVVIALSLAALAAAIAIAVRARLGSRAETVAAATVAWAAIVATPIYALGLAGQLTRGKLAVASLAVSAAALAASWPRGQRGAARALLRDAASLARLPCEGFALAIRRMSAVTFALGLASFAFVVNLAAAYYLPSWRSWDALWYHEPIMGFTIQNHGFAVVDLPFAGAQKINGYPRLDEMLGLFFGIFAGRRLIDLPNVILMPGLVCAVYAAARRHSNDRVACMGWACCIATIPAYFELLQTTFTDPAVTTFIVIGFLFCTRRRGEPIRDRDAILASVALALACNTKINGVFPAVALSVITAARLFAARGLRAARVVAIGAAILVGASAATYVRNLVLFHNPVWPDLRVDVASLGIHWPGLMPWGDATASTPDAQVNMQAPWSVLFSELTAAPFTVADREHRYIYKYGLGVIWIAMPLIAIALGVIAVRAGAYLRRVRSGAKLDPALADGAVAAVTFGVMGATSTALWAPRYNLAMVAVGAVLVAWTFPKRRAGRLRPRVLALAHEGVVAVVAIGSTVILGWDTPGFQLVAPSEIGRMLVTPYPESEMTRELGSPVRKDIALLREADLTAGESVITDDYGFTAILWNNDYSNRVICVRPGTNLDRAADEHEARWIYASTWEVAQRLASTGRWESLGTLFVRRSGFALRRRSGGASRAR